MDISPAISDPDTRRLLACVVWCLAKYFGHNDTTATSAVNAFYERFRERFTDDFYHHEGAYSSALLMHYVHDLAGAIENFTEWRHKAGFRETPSEALAYFREQYFIR